MSLYDGVDIENDGGGSGKNSVVSGWSSSYKLLHSQLQAKKANLIQSKQKQRSNATLAPVIDLKKTADAESSPLHFNLQTGKLERMVQDMPLITPNPGPGLLPTPTSIPVPNVTSFITGLELGPALYGYTDEYHPLRPNDYEDVMKKRRAQKQKEIDEERKREKEMESRSTARPSQRNDAAYVENENRSKRNIDDDGEKEFEKMRRRREEEEEDDYEKPKRNASAGAAIAPPPSLLEDNGPPPPEASDERPRSPPGGFPLGSGSVASRIMARYGYKAGQGLGKLEQGMSTALFVEKTSKRGGKIIHEKDLAKEAAKEPPSNTNILRNPSKVILLRNMVGPGEVDEELEPEVAEECSKYGKVLKVMIFEIPSGDEEEAVRIFVEFDRIESATKALVDLNGRYFGGRIVKGTFYNLDKFRRLDLADPPE